MNLIWDYMHVGHKLKKAGILLVMGSTDIRVASYAAELYKDGWAPLIVVSGDGRNHENAILEYKYDGRTEAEVFNEILIKEGVSESDILLENRANNTEENFTLTRKLLSQQGILPKNAVVVTKPYMERRAYATGKNFWPELKIVMTSPPLTYQEFVEKHDLYDEDSIINCVVGDLHRIKEYPKRGFQIEQDIPDKVWQAFEYLVSIGYTKKLLS